MNYIQMLNRLYFEVLRAKQRLAFDNDNIDNLDEINKNTKLDDVEKLKAIDINTNKNSNKTKEEQVNKEFNTANTTDESDKTKNNN